ncbi:MAG: hypothetical protein MUO21_02480 [Nitrososphaeraceae archaeon]|nr:hypothetical protein [Nitrososphaeraceae archaeon]
MINIHHINPLLSIINNLYKMLLNSILFFTLIGCCLASSPIRSITHYSESSFNLAKFEKNKCHKVDIHMVVRCIITGTFEERFSTSTTIGRMYTEYNNTVTFLRRFWARRWTVINGMMTANDIMNDIILIGNSTEFNQTLRIEKGENCLNSPIHIDIYRFNVTEVVCPVHNKTDSRFFIMLSLIFIGFLLLFKKN